MKVKELREALWGLPGDSEVRFRLWERGADGKLTELSNPPVTVVTRLHGRAVIDVAPYDGITGTAEMGVSGRKRRFKPLGIIRENEPPPPPEALRGEEYTGPMPKAGDVWGERGTPHLAAISSADDESVSFRFTPRGRRTSTVSVSTFLARFDFVKGALAP